MSRAESQRQAGNRRAWQVICRTCGALAGQCCVSRSGRTQWNHCHASRYADAEKINPQNQE
jgi:hypothetical protein